MIRLHRLLSTLVLSLLLVGMQLGNELHALGHIREALSQTPDHSLSAPGDDMCATCALFAGGASAVAGGDTGVDATLAVDENSPPAPASITPAFSSYYYSRAPPSLL